MVGLIFIIPVVLSCLWALEIPQGLGFLMFPEQVACLILGSAVAAIFLSNWPNKTKYWKFFDGLLATLAFGLGIHIFIRFQVLSEGAFFHPTESLAVGVLIVLTSLEALRRVSGWSLILILLRDLLFN